MRFRTPLAIAVLLAGVSAGVAHAAKAPVTVSPGRADHLAQVEVRCPTFNWGTVAGAESYQLVVYRLGEEASNEEAKPVVRADVPGSATGWTPAMDQCLDRGGRYAWTVRAVGGKETSEWSAPALFQVAAPTQAEFQEALEVVRQYLQTEGGWKSFDLTGTHNLADPGPEPKPKTLASPPIRSTATTVTTELAVDGGVEAAYFVGETVVNTYNLSSLLNLLPLASSSGLCQGDSDRGSLWVRAGSSYSTTGDTICLCQRRYSSALGRYVYAAEALLTTSPFGVGPC